MSPLVARSSLNLTVLSVTLILGVLLATWSVEHSAAASDCRASAPCSILEAKLVVPFNTQLTFKEW